MTIKKQAPDLSGIDYSTLREPLRDGMKNWLEHGIQPGGFLSAVIANNLTEAFGRADEHNIAAMFSIVSWFYNFCPRMACGSPDRARNWAALFARDFDWVD